MTLKAIVNEAAFGELAEPLQGLYQQNNETKDYYLDLETGEADKLAFGLKEQIEKLSTNNKKLLDEKVKALEKMQEAERLATEAAANKKPEGDDPAIAEKHSKELEALKKSFEDEIENQKAHTAELNAKLAKAAQEREIAKLITDYSLDPEYAQPVLKEYIRAEVVDHNVFVNVYENGEKALVAGAPKTPENLLDGFLKNGKYKGMFVAGNGGGSGASNNQRSGNVGAKTMRRSDFDKLMQSDPLGAGSFVKEGGKVVD